MVAQYGFHHNADICIGCKVCVIACKDKNDLALGEKFRRVYDIGGGDWEEEGGVLVPKNVYSYSVSVSCNHCANPACVEACPVGSMTKREDGIVCNDSETCIGCGSCALACPYSAPFVSEQTKISQKCNFCMDLIDKGETPVCVSSCLMRALDFGELSELKEKYGDVSQVVPLPDPATTEPSFIITPSRHNPDGALEGTILNSPEEIESVTVV